MASNSCFDLKSMVIDRIKMCKVNHISCHWVLDVVDVQISSIINIADNPKKPIEQKKDHATKSCVTHALLR